MSESSIVTGITLLINVPPVKKEKYNAERLLVTSAEDIRADMGQLGLSERCKVQVGKLVRKILYMQKPARRHVVVSKLARVLHKGNDYAKGHALWLLGISEDVLAFKMAA